MIVFDYFAVICTPTAEPEPQLVCGKIEIDAGDSAERIVDDEARDWIIFAGPGDRTSSGEVFVFQESVFHWKTFPESHRAAAESLFPLLR